MNTNLQERIRLHLLGDFRRWRLWLADNGGWGASEFIGGFDTVEEAVEAVQAISGLVDASDDPAVDLYYWIKDRDNEDRDAYYWQGRDYELGKVA